MKGYYRSTQTWQASRFFKIVSVILAIIGVGTFLFALMGLTFARELEYYTTLFFAGIGVICSALAALFAYYHLSAMADVMRIAERYNEVLDKEHKDLMA